MLIINKNENSSLNEHIYFHAANLNDTFRLPYWLWVSFVQGCTSYLARQSRCGYGSRFTSRKMIQLRAIYRKALRHAEHFLSVKNRLTVSLIINHKFDLNIHQCKFTSLMILNLCDSWMELKDKRQFCFWRCIRGRPPLVNQMIM